MTLTCNFTEGVVYGDKEILRAPFGFNVKVGDTMKHIDIDGRAIGALPVDLFGFSMEDFSHLPINEYGLITVAEYWVNKLMVTSQGLFVIYSHGFPSLRGLPCEVGTVSGPWVTTIGNVLVPNFSLFTQSEYTSNTVLSLLSTFNPVDETTFRLAMELSQETFSDGNFAETYTYCNIYNMEFNASEYIFIYPRFNNNDKERYERIMTEGKSQFRELGGNF